MENMNNIINDNEKIEMNKENIRTALVDYNRHIPTAVEYSETFVERLAKDNYYAKNDLRNLFRKSPAWNEELDALIINGNRTHAVDYNRIYDLWYALIPADTEVEYSRKYNMTAIRNFFATPSGAKNPKNIKAIEALTGATLREGQKKSKTLRKVLTALNLTERVNTRIFADIADEMSAKAIPFKLFISLNPAHFLTMSNPYDDERGATMVSCHALNSTYSYKNGATGYARDKVSFIVFTANPDEPETLNNRKKSRQIFAYSHSVLLQSRLYSSEVTDSYGGVDEGDKRFTEIVKLYRNLVQKEIADALNVPNLWKTRLYIDEKQREEYNRKNEFDIDIYPHPDYCGYTDWDILGFGARVSVLNGEDYTHSIEMGAGGLCLKCGEVFDADEGFEGGIYCEDCRQEEFFCDCCEDYCTGEQYDAYMGGNSDTICETCREEYFFTCDRCGELHHIDDGIYITDGDFYVCEQCADRHYYYCEQCGEYHAEPTVEVHDERGNITNMCEACAEYHAAYCESCDEYFVNDLITEYHGQYLCPDCRECREEQEEEA